MPVLSQLYIYPIKLPGGIALERAMISSKFLMQGGIPFEEDTIEQLTINGIDFCGVKLCSRRMVTTTDQETGLPNFEPLKL